MAGKGTRKGMREFNNWRVRMISKLRTVFGCCFLPDEEVSKNEETSVSIPGVGKDCRSEPLDLKNSKGTNNDTFILQSCQQKFEISDNETINRESAATGNQSVTISSIK